MQKTVQAKPDPLAEPIGSTAPSPVPHPSGEARKPWAKWILVSAIAVGAILGLLVMIAIVGVVFLGRGLESSASGPVELAVVDGAPPADIVMVVSPVNSSGADAEQRFRDANVSSGQPLEPDSVVHVATVTTPYDTYEMFRWNEIGTSKGPIGDVQLCAGGMGNLGGFATCGDSIVGEPPSISAGSTQSGSEFSFSLRVDNLGTIDGGATWLIVDTASGLQVATEIVDGMAYLEWPSGDASEAPATGVRALDADMHEIWSAPVS